jgi:hypothetical protein
MSHTNWTPGLVVLLVGMVIGVVYVLLMRRRSGPFEAVAADDRIADLDTRYRSLISQLKELAADQHLFSAEKFAAEKLRLETEAAAVLRQKDEHRGVKHEQLKADARAAKQQAAQAEAAKTFFGRNPALKGAAWTLLLVAFFGGLGILLSQEAKERPQGGPGQMAGPMQQRPEEKAPEDIEFERLIARLQKEPDNVDLLAQVTHELILRQDMQNAVHLTMQGTSIDPFHVETRIHRALLDGSQGQPGAAVAELEKIASLYPNSSEALLYVGVLSQQMGNTAKAVQALEKYAAETPPSEQPPMLREGIEALKRRMSEPGPN